MSSPTSGPLAGLRVGVITVAGTWLACAAHVAAGGGMPSPGVIGAGAVAPALAGVWLSRRRFGPLTTMAVLGGVQLMLHLWFSGASMAGLCLSPGGGHLRHGAAVAAAAAAGCGSAPESAHRMSLMGHAGQPSWMTLAHVLAVVATALVLAATDRALWRLLAWLRPALAVVRGALPVVPGAGPTFVVPAFAVSRVAVRPCGGLGRRGPPRP